MDELTLFEAYTDASRRVAALRLAVVNNSAFAWQKLYRIGKAIDIVQTEAGNAYFGDPQLLAPPEVAA